MTEDSLELQEVSKSLSRGETPQLWRTFFPREELPKGLDIGDREGLELATEQARGGGLPGDEERLRRKYKDLRNGYGGLAWREVGAGLLRIYGLDAGRQVAEMLAEVRQVHDTLKLKAEALPAVRQTYYHNVGEWTEGNGHADQVMIGAAREMAGALELGELDPQEFHLRKIGLVLQAMAVHDADWSLVDKKTQMRVNGEELFGIAAQNL